MVVILAPLGAVAVATCVWCGHHARRELARRRQATQVRAALAGQTSVAELRERCCADEMPRYPTPSRAVGDPDPAAPGGSTVRVGGAS